jgi:hypothetical protein
MFLHWMKSASPSSLCQRPTNPDRSISASETGRLFHWKGDQGLKNVSVSWLEADRIHPKPNCGSRFVVRSRAPFAGIGSSGSPRRKRLYDMEKTGLWAIWQSLAGRIGYFSTAFWSRATADCRLPAEKMRFLRINVQGSVRRAGGNQKPGNRPNTPCAEIMKTQQIKRMTLETPGKKACKDRSRLSANLADSPPPRSCFSHLFSNAKDA